MRALRLLAVAGSLLWLAGCEDKKAASTDKGSDDEGARVEAYCDKMLELDEKTAADNGHEAFPEGEHPTRSEARGFCKAMFRRALQKEPKAFACFERCMKKAKSRTAEQKCLADDECLSLAENKKLFSNRKD